MIFKTHCSYTRSLASVCAAIQGRPEQLAATGKNIDQCFYDGVLIPIVDAMKANFDFELVTFFNLLFNASAAVTVATLDGTPAVVKFADIFGQRKVDKLPDFIKNTDDVDEVMMLRARYVIGIMGEALTCPVVKANRDMHAYLSHVVDFALACFPAVAVLECRASSPDEFLSMWAKVGSRAQELYNQVFVARSETEWKQLEASTRKHLTLLKVEALREKLAAAGSSEDGGKKKDDMIERLVRITLDESKRKEWMWSQSGRRTCSHS